jgi:hypothetical protein
MLFQLKQNVCKNSSGVLYKKCVFPFFPTAFATTTFHFHKYLYVITELHFRCAHKPHTLSTSKVPIIAVWLQPKLVYVNEFD